MMAKRLLRILVLSTSLAAIFFSQAQAAIVTSVFPGNGAGSIIPPFGTTGLLNVSANVGVSGTIIDVNVRLDLLHSWDGDLDITLIGPSGTSVDLSSDNGGSGDNYTNTVFDDEALVSITAGTAPFTGSFIPEVALSNFDGQDLLGIWTLRIFDDAGGDTGLLKSWGLEITYDNLSNVPVPAAVWLFGTALIGVAGFSRRKKAA